MKNVVGRLHLGCMLMTMCMCVSKNQLMGPGKQHHDVLQGHNLSLIHIGQAGKQSIIIMIIERGLYLVEVRSNEKEEK